MASSGEDYFVVRQQKTQRKKKIISIISLIGFGGSILFGAFGTIQRAIQTPQPQPAATIPVESSLQEQARGYELVLQREPENQVALEKLSLLRIQLEDLPGAMEPLEKLTSLHPERQDYQVMLENVKKWQMETN
ncbi:MULTISPECIES: tetratricopeptide repeat protein [Cyanophyceae]|uniref:tetratricopeptide repeat protein n=1 Tax=Cyanophyceae TaxID=3028117 RepID=UPI00232F2D38|nr:MULTISPECIES: tetratricopeptide repeat protein [Cyanophyceae]MDB9358215.1 tetratricopeptide repeat protein [Nodularia spumigena CS-587/03]MDB9316115.1 tetratricopeptide repeat protein [Nodularia spumigena CS-590/01A]MDB9322007.1 tetratricopeptide repeat protein [Nodularia spumigena CS-591/07A]MDB9325433.1 tetratricopeptide repeat protein [Nodularia spumigena CS-590/02]MDB9331468.1 tetratricopeptide repeat protein [Nodularia spumigena CS-591/04]